MEIGGYENTPAWPKMGPSLLIATCLNCRDPDGAMVGQ